MHTVAPHQNPPSRGIGVAGLRFALLVLALCPPAMAADEAPGEALLRGSLNTLERLVQQLDGLRPMSRADGTRIWDLHRRLWALEGTYGLPHGRVSERYDLRSMLIDVADLGRRAKAVFLARAQQSAPPRELPNEGVFDVKPPDPAGVAPAQPPAPTGPSAAKDMKWPERLTFKATGKLNYQPVGEWLLGDHHRTGWGPDFLQTGTTGRLSFSVRAGGLKREVRTAELRLVARVGYPFVLGGSALRVLDLTWKSERALNNDALKTWVAVDRLSIPGPYRWIDDPKASSASVDVEAHVRSVTMHDGTTFHFLAPEYVLRR